MITRLLVPLWMIGVASLLHSLPVAGQDAKPQAAEADARQPILLADFEAEDYGKWRVEGDAFGPGPAKGTLPGQMHVDGYLGERLVNTFFKGDGTTGALTSPPFTIERKHLNFLIGGGGYAGETCINLIIDGKTVRTATGPNTLPGGSERLSWHSWDVGEFNGRQAVIRIVDARKGGWGHINIDHIELSDKRRGLDPAELTRSIKVEKRYLHLPVKTGSPKSVITMSIDGEQARRFEIEYNADEPDFWVFTDVSEFAGKTLTLRANSIVGETGLSAVKHADQLLPRAAADELYREKDRPQFHFTSRRGWLNDPNGLVYHGGQWHLYYQHNPFGWNWGNMHWGHAVSKDLLHWRELGDVLYPWSAHAKGACFSGCGLVDKHNTAGFKKGGLGDTGGDVIVVAFTDTDAGEAIAYSNDGGRSFEVYEGNPVVKHRGRDPKIIWHEPTKRWVMAVYNEDDGKRWIAFHSSPNLKEWRFESRIEGFFECPDIFELPVDGEGDSKMWVVYAADGRYVLGGFDGRTFSPRHEGKHQVWWGDFYAAQTYSDAPDNRRVQIGWARGVTFKDMPFNQQMTIPVELSLRKTADGVRMFAEPVRELANIRGESHEWKNVKFRDGDDNPLAAIDAELLEVEATIRVSEPGVYGLDVRGARIAFDTKKNELFCHGVKAPLRPVGGKVRLHVLIDRGSVECFANGGRVAVSKHYPDSEGKRTVRPIAEGAPGAAVTFESIRVHVLESVWKRNQN